MVARRQTPDRGPPFAGRVPDPITPVVLRRPSPDLGDLVELFAPLPFARKIRTAPRASSGPARPGLPKRRG
jgi:hypothetical protein